MRAVEISARYLRAARDGGWPGLWHHATHEDAAQLVQGQQVYLATPYTRPVQQMIAGGWALRDAELVIAREAAAEVAELARLGVSAVSPIVLAVALRHARGPMAAPEPFDADFWTRWCAPILQASGAVVVPDLPGRRESEGIWHEITVSLSRNVRVFWLI